MVEGEVDFKEIEHDMGVTICSTSDPKIRIQVERDRKQTMILNYLLSNIETNIKCLRYLPFS